MSKQPVTVPAPPADRIPRNRVAGCEYCNRYNRACGRHESGGKPAKTTYIATAPDGTQITRTSARTYTHAVLVEYRRRDRDVIEGTTRWGYLSFNGREELARKEAAKWQPFIAERRWSDKGNNVQEKFLRTLVVEVVAA